MEPSTSPQEGPKGKHRKVRIAITALVVLALFVGARLLGVQDLLKSALGWISGLGPWGPAIFSGLYIVATVLFVPGAILTLGAGVVWGVVWGSVIVSIASTLGAGAAFLAGRYVARDWVARKVAGRPKFQAIDDAVAREGWKIVGLTRLSPIFPFNLLNYAFGLTQVRFTHYLLASWVGMMPGTVMYVYLGSLAGDLATLGTGARTRSPVEWALYVVGLIATVAVTVYVTRIARRALEKKV